MKILLLIIINHNNNNNNNNNNNHNNNTNNSTNNNNTNNNDTYYFVNIYAPHHVSQTLRPMRLRPNQGTVGPPGPQAAYRPHNFMPVASPKTGFGYPLVNKT